jgi:glutathione peroxidase
MKALARTSLAALMLGWSPLALAEEEEATAAPAKDRDAPASIHEFKVKTIDGKELDLKELAGKVLIVVNVASRCGLTDDQYAGLEALFRKHRDRGLEILAFPANNFGRQEPGTNVEIKAFCAAKDVSFRLFEKISVKGDDIHPLYKWLTDKEVHPKTGGEVKWNFQKFLIGVDGKVRARFEPSADPQGDELARALDPALKEVKPSAKKPAATE